MTVSCKHIKNLKRKLSRKPNKKDWGSGPQTVPKLKHIKGPKLKHIKEPKLNREPTFLSDEGINVRERFKVLPGYIELD